MLPVVYEQPHGPFRQIAAYRHDKTATYRVAPGWTHAVWYPHGEVVPQRAERLNATRPAPRARSPEPPTEVAQTPSAPPGPLSIRALFLRYCDGELLTDAQYRRIDTRPMPEDIARDCLYIK